MTNKKITNPQEFNNFVIFSTENGKVNINVLWQQETLWLTQKNMAELFEVNIPAISKHLQNIFKTGELVEQATISILETVQQEGARKINRKIEYYNLNAIIAVGYRINSYRAIEFRKWATEVLHQYIIKGFVIDDERLKQIKHFGKDYFDEMLEKIREIRLSERRFYQKITDIYALSADYDKKAEITKFFFATVQNKLHWAITGKTAAEIIYSKADADKTSMGLKTWKNAPQGKILKSDTLIAKNYLSKKDLQQLAVIVSAYLDLAENRVQRQIVMNMKDWLVFLNKFLELANYSILTHAGKFSMFKAKIKAASEYKKYRVIQDKDYISDFDHEVKKILGNNSNK